MVAAPPFQNVKNEHGLQTDLQINLYIQDIQIHHYSYIKMLACIKNGKEMIGDQRWHKGL